MASRKLTDEQVVEARRLYRNGHSMKQVSLGLGICTATSKAMLIGHTYRHVAGAIGNEEIHGRGRSGSANSQSVIDEEGSRRVRSLLLGGATFKEVAAVSGISYGQVVKISRGKSWSSTGDRLSLNPLRNKRFGSATGLAKLNETSVSHIKAHLKVGVARLLLAKYFKVCKSTITQIALEYIWKHVKPHPKPPPLIFSTEREKPIRLRGDRLKAKLDEVKAARRESVAAPTKRKKGRKTA